MEIKTVNREIHPDSIIGNDVVSVRFYLCSRVLGRNIFLLKKVKHGIVPWLKHEQEIVIDGTRFRIIGKPVIDFSTDMKGGDGVMEVELFAVSENLDRELIEKGWNIQDP